VTTVNIDVIITIENENDTELYFNETFVPEMIEKNIKNSNPDAKVYYSIPSNYTGKLLNSADVFKREGSDDIVFWKTFFNSTSSEHAAVINGDSPFFDPEILKEMSDIHIKYLAEFTFSENLPEGFACEIISRELVNQIPETNEKSLPIGKVIRANINKFDVELFYKEPDIRSKRISFRLNNVRDRKVMENLFAVKKSIPAYAEVKDLIESNPETLFIGPSYLELEITGKCPLDCLFCYRKSLSSGEHGEMEYKTFTSILEEMKNFEMPYTLCFTGSGEPMQHPEFYSFMEAAVKESLVEQLIIETNGIKADSNFKGFISKPENSKVKVIINNNGLDKESYLRFHKTDAYDSVLKNILSLAGLNSGGERIYIQIMKINETDEFTKENDIKSYLDKYYDFWEGQKVPIILQKQNTYFGRIPDRRYSDLSPVKRTPCWHLQRDLYILSDGTVSFCKQDIDGENSYGNIKKDRLTGIWNNQKKAFLEDYSGNFPSNPDCKDCDEWYTFNF
jgi:spiro-SPASM protein